MHALSLQETNMVANRRIDSALFYGQVISLIPRTRCAGDVLLLFLNVLLSLQNYLLRFSFE